MAIVDINTVKTYLGITDSSQDGLLNILVPAANAIIEQIIGPTNVADRTIFVETCDVLRCCGQSCMFLPTLNVLAILEVNGQTYNGVLDTDYFISGNKNTKVCFNDLRDYPANDNYCKVKIKYSSGYSSIPKDLELVGCMIVAGLYAQDKGQAVKAYKVGDVSVTLADTAEMSANTSYTSLNSILAPYKSYSV